MWGVGFPREWIDVAWTSFGRRSDVVFFSSIYHIPYLTLHFQIHYSFYNKPLSKTIHQRLALPPMQLKNPTLPTGLLFLKLPPPPCAVLLVSVNQNEAKISAAFRWWFGLQAWHRHDFLETAFGWGKTYFQHRRDLGMSLALSCTNNTSSISLCLKLYTKNGHFCREHDCPLVIKRGRWTVSKTMALVDD